MPFCEEVIQMYQRRICLFCLGLLVLSILPSTKADPIAISTFDSGNEGWLVVSTEGYVGPADWSPTGGNPGGYIYDTDMDDGGWGFLAPAKFLGNVSAAYGHTLSFDFSSDRIEHDTIGIVFADTTGIGIITHVDLPDYPGQIAHRELVLNTSHQWYVFDYINDIQGQLATTAQIQAALSDLGFLFLGAEFAPGYDDDGTYEFGELVAYDNVILIPEPASVIMLAFATFFLTRRRK